MPAHFIFVCAALGAAAGSRQSNVFGSHLLAAHARVAESSKTAAEHDGVDARRTGSIAEVCHGCWTLGGCNTALDEDTCIGTGGVWHLPAEDAAEEGEGVEFKDSHAFDFNKDGEVSKEELRRAMGEDISDEDCAELAAALNTDPNISVAEDAMGNEISLAQFYPQTTAYYRHCYKVWGHRNCFWSEIRPQPHNNCVPSNFEQKEWYVTKYKRSSSPTSHRWSYRWRLRCVCNCLPGYRYEGRGDCDPRRDPPSIQLRTIQNVRSSKECSQWCNKDLKPPCRFFTFTSSCEQNCFKCRLYPAECSTNSFSGTQRFSKI